MNIEQRHQILAQHVTTGQGRARIAASMIAPLRRRRDYYSVGRKAFYVEPLPDGALSIYDKDAEVAAYVVAEEGDNIVSIVKPQRVHIPIFELAANPEIRLTEIRQRRFDLITRSVDLASSQIMAEEDRKIFACMDAACDDTTNPNDEIEIIGNLTAASLADAFASIERHDLRVAHIFMNAKDFSDFRKWDRDTLDPVTQADLLKTGVMANLWGAQMVASRVVPEGTLYVCAEPEFLGRIPVRADLTVLSADDPKARTIGFSIFENLGVGLHNPYGIVKVTIERA